MAAYGLGVPSYSDFQWVGGCSGGVPPNAVLSGYDNGSPIYVGRAFFSGALIPGKVHPAHGCCYVAWGGRENSLKSYEVLCTVGAGQAQWESCYGDNISPSAVHGGSTEDGEPLYVGRHTHNGSMVPGKVQRSHSCLYIAYAGKEHMYRDYEVLISRPSPYMPPNQPGFPSYPQFPNYPQPPAYPNYPGFPGNPGTCPPW